MFTGEISKASGTTQSSSKQAYRRFLMSCNPGTMSMVVTIEAEVAKSTLHTWWLDIPNMFICKFPSRCIMFPSLSQYGRASEYPADTPKDGG
jgi:hypothetical protein